MSATGRCSFRHWLLCTAIAVVFPILAEEQSLTYEDALERAKTSGKDIAVFQRGSDWNKLAETLYKNVWCNEEFRALLGDGFILVAVDRPENIGGSAALRLVALADDKNPLPPNELTDVEGAKGSVFKRRADGAFVAQASPNPGQEVLTLKIKTARGGKVLRLDFPTDDTLPGNGPGRAGNGNFAVSEVDGQANGKAVKFTGAWANASEGSSGPWRLVDGSDKSDSIWNAAANQHKRRTLLLGLSESIAANSELVVRLHCNSPWGQHVPGCIRAAMLSETSLEADVSTVAQAQLLNVKNSKFSWWDSTFCPRIALMDSQGRAVASENKPRLDLTPKKMADLLKALRQKREQRDALWKKAELARGPEKAELLRQGLEVLGFGNWEGNEKCYKLVHDEMRKADLNDESGAVRWLGFGYGAFGKIPWAPGNEWQKALDGKKNLTDEDYNEALARIDRELKDPRNRILKTEHIQHMMVAKYHVYKRWPGHEEQRFDVQREIAALDPTTFWGIGAIGYAGMYRVSPQPMLTYGWGPKQLKAGSNTWNMTDTAYFFDHAGSYTLSFSHAGGKDGIRIKRAALLDGTTVLSEAAPDAAQNEVAKGKSVAVELALKEWKADRKLVVRVEAEVADGKTDCKGDFRIEPQLAPLVVSASVSTSPKPAAGEASVRDLLLRGDISALQKTLADKLLAEAGDEAVSPSLRALLAQHELIRCCQPEKVAETSRSEKGAELLNVLFNDTEWLESFLSSGKADFAQSLENLRLLYQYGSGFDKPVYRRMATALSLQWGKGSRYRLVDRFGHIQRAHQDGLLHAVFDSYNVREMRWAVYTAGTAKDYQFLLDDRQTRVGDYLGACWAIAYVDPNVYGYSVQGWGFVDEWRHHYGTGTGDRPFAAHRLMGGVCGTLSGFGAAVTKVHGVMSTTVGQPAHCAYVVRIGEHWPIGNDVSGPASTGFSVYDGTNYAGTTNTLYEKVEADREPYMKAMRLIWLARLHQANAASADGTRTPGRWNSIYEKAVSAQPINYDTWLQYIVALEGAKDVPAKTWLHLGARACKTFIDFPDAGWALIRRMLGKAAPAMSLQERTAFLLNCHEELRSEKTPKAGSYNVSDVLNWQADHLKKDPALTADFFRRLLTIHFSKTPATNHVFGNVINWGRERFGGNAATSSAFASTMESFFKSQGDVDKNLLVSAITNGIRKASETGDRDSFRIWNDMAEKMLPPLQPGDIHLNAKQAGAAPAIEPFSGALLSKDGLLQTSSASKSDRPLAYRKVLSGEGSGWFETNNEESPWAQVQLPGEAKLSGLVLVNRYEFASTHEEFQWQSPLKVLVSADGKKWTQIGAFDKAEAVFRLNLEDKNISARYVRIERTPSADKSKPGRFHLRNFLVYGKKLY